MNLKDYIQIMRPAIEHELQRVVNVYGPSDYPGLKEMLTYHMGWEGEGAGPDAQGKRIRPLVVLLAAQAASECCQPDLWQQALPAAAAVELLHNFSLVHDDIQDQSPLRRNRKTVWVKWGIAQAINAGDVLFTLSFLALHDLAPVETVARASRMLQTTCLRLTEGQYLDLSYESQNELPMDAYWPMIGGKTSALLSCCAGLGALVAGAGKARLSAFQEYGYSVGLAFQVLDDWLGIWGDVSLTGKSVESDLVAGKKSLPVLYGLSKAGRFARRWKEGSIRPEEVGELSQWLTEDGAQDFTLQTAQTLTDKALAALREASYDNEAAQALEELTNQLLNRKH